LLPTPWSSAWQLGDKRMLHVSFVFLICCFVGSACSLNYNALPDWQPTGLQLPLHADSTAAERRNLYVELIYNDDMRHGVFF
jgi:hypothetical protein